MSVPTTTSELVDLHGRRIFSGGDFDRPPVDAGTNRLEVIYRNQGICPLVPQIIPCTWKLGAYEPGVRMDL